MIIDDYQSFYEQNIAILPSLRQFVIKCLVNYSLNLDYIIASTYDRIYDLRDEHGVLGIGYCVLRIAYWVLGIGYCVLRIAYCVLRIA